MTLALSQTLPSRLRIAAFSPIGDEGRTELVASRLVQAISVGAFTEGERLPTEAELATLFGVAVVTVREALSDLRNRGLIETLRGRNGGSFVRSSRSAIEMVNVAALMNMPRVDLADMGLHYEMVACACIEYAATRAMPNELDAITQVLSEIQTLPAHAWRRRIAEIQLEIAALSQSVRLMNEHIRLQTEMTPFLALQDLDLTTRAQTQNSLLVQISAIQRGDAEAARASVRESVRASVRWLVDFRTKLLAIPDIETLQETLEERWAAANSTVPFTAEEHS